MFLASKGGRGRGGARRGQSEASNTTNSQSNTLPTPPKPLLPQRISEMLNNLTPENVEKFLGKFMQLPKNDIEHWIPEVIKVVFEKAIDEPSTSAYMVSSICKSSLETSRTLRKQILDQCQREFQKNTSGEDEIKQAKEKLAAATEDKKEQLKLDLEEMKCGRRRRFLGNVRFIGELYKFQMLTPKIMVECVNILLNSPDEENLECLCILLSTVGQKLDENLSDQEAKIEYCKANKLELPKFNPDDKYMDKTFGKLRKLSDNKALSSKIRFALLDVVDLRENGWKPRRDTNPPKTIEELRREVIRQKMEDKRQINSLLPASSGGVRQGISSRFQVKKPDQSGMPVLTPSGGAWGRGQHPIASNTNSQSNTSPTPPKPLLPPRFNRFHGLSVDVPRSSSNVCNNQSPSNYRDPVPQQMTPSQFPPLLRRPSPTSSTVSPPKLSRPVTPKEPSPAISVDECTTDVRETAKNIFEQYFIVKKFDDTLHWINSRFPGDRIGVFVQELSRQVCDMSKVDQQKTAGHLVRLLLKNKIVTKTTVLNVLVKGIIQDLPDIIDAPNKVTKYLGQFLVEIFVDENDLNWLVTVVDPLYNEEFATTGEELISNTLHLLKLRRNEKAVQVLFKKTDKKIALQRSVPWLALLPGESIQSPSKKKIPMFKSRLNSPEEIMLALQINMQVENSGGGPHVGVFGPQFHWVLTNVDELFEKIALCKEEIGRIINHVFLPRKLPQSQLLHQTASDESKLLTMMTETVKTFQTNIPKFLPISTVRMFNTWDSLQCCSHLDENDVQKSIDSLKPGDMFALYIRKQNCGLLLSAPKDKDRGERLFLSTFAASPSNDIVTKSSGDLQRTFPHQSIHIPMSQILTSLAFAKQLATLHNTDFEKAMAEAIKAGTSLSNCRDVADTIFVSEWLAATLADKDSANISFLEFPYVVKKVRDEVLLKKDKGTDTLFPFRRSGFWMTIKAALQLNLTHELGLRDGLFLYKMIMSQLLATICQFLLAEQYGELDIDLAIQMIAKLARRLEKLDKLAATTTNSALLEIRQILHRETVEIIANVRTKINTQYDLMLDIDKRECQLQPLGKLDFENDIYHKIPNLKVYLARKDTSKYATSSGAIFRPKILGRCGHQFPSVSILQETDEISLGVALYDIENWILEYLNGGTGDAISIRNLAFVYSEKATEYYKNDPVGYSRMVLTFFKIIKVLDSIAVESYPLLNEHRIGVNPEIISQLLLPRKKDLEYAYEFEEYIEERNKTEMYPSLVEEDSVTEKSFSARYGKINAEMCRKRNEILAIAAQNVLRKKAEVEVLRERVAVLKLELIGMECDKVNIYIRRWRTFKEVHSRDCRKHAKEKEKNEARVDVYEHPLRDEEYNQNAVVFELLIPVEIACLRDVLYIFSAEICQFSLASTYSCSNWQDSSQLSHYHRGQQQRTFLGSSNRSFSSTHFSTHHVDTSIDQIIVRNSGSCIFFGKHRSTDNNTKLQSNSAGSIKRFCTFQVESGQYQGLQWALEGTSHSQNKIIASQSECPESLTLTEWNEFGSLRSGNRLQIRNIYMAIENGRLSFKTESVLMLILQALWEGGANSDFPELWSRDAHIDFTDDAKFCEQFVKILDKFLTTQRNNWKHPYNLLTIIMITIRALEINSDISIVELFTNLLIKCRIVAVEWISSIEDVMKVSSNFDICEKLRNNLVNVGICCALTFNVDPRLPCFSRILNYKNDGLRIWILALVTIDNNITLSKDKDAKILKPSIDGYLYFHESRSMGRSSGSFTRRNFLRMIRNTGINIEKNLKEIISAERFRSFNVLAREYFSADHKDTDHWEAHGTVFCKRTKDRDQVERLLQVDLLQGKFLVDNLPVSRLPEAIVSSEVFRSVFGQTVLDVQPFGKDSFRTINKFNGCKYLFRVASDSALITEERPDGYSYDLIPHTLFQNEVVHLLVEKYCHWWCRDKKVIEFKPLPFNLNGDDDSKANDHHYALSLETFKLTDAESGNTIIDVRSNSFIKISSYLSRFELAKYIKIFIESKGQQCLATVELSRMRLKFKAVEIDQKIHLESNEYEGMRVSLQHKIDGCFTGLGHGLVLEDISGSKELFLVPHGDIHAHAQRNGPQTALISLEELREPKFFKFEVNERLRQFKAGKSYSAWFYLAYLHGLTAQPLEDPFTGMTGTEQALDILSSPHCWSNEPFDEASLLIMAELSELTPKREFYSAGHIKSMQTVTFPTFLPSTAAHDLYLHIVLTLIEGSQRLNCLFKSIKDGQRTDIKRVSSRAQTLRLSSIRGERNFCYEDDLEKESCSKLKRTIKSTAAALNLRAYKRHSCSNPNICVKKDFQESVSEFPIADKDDIFRESLQINRYPLSSSPRKYRPTDSISQDSVIGQMRKLSALVHEKSYFVPRDSEQVLTEFSRKSSPFQGVTEKTFMGLRVDNWNLINLRDSFLDLYNFVRKMDKLDLNLEWPLFLNCLAFNQNNLDVLFILQTIAENSKLFQNLDPPNFSVYQNPEQNYFQKETVQTIFQSCPSVSESDYLTDNGCDSYSNPFDYGSQEYKEYKEKRTDLCKKYKQELTLESQQLTTTISSAWPLDNCDSLVLPSKLVNVYQAKSKINPLLQKWNQNRQLTLFLEAVWAKCKSLLTSNFPLDLVKFLPWTQNKTVQKHRTDKFQINFEEKMSKQFDCPLGFTDDVKKIYETGILPCEFEFLEKVLPSDVPLPILQKRKMFFHEKSEEFWKIIEELSAPAEVSHLVKSGIYPRIVPVRMLSRLIPKETKAETVDGLENLIGACAVSWTYEQQAIRMIRFSHKIQNFENSMRRELETNAEESNWSPKARPEWLLFELEMNLKIRQIQVEVAERMIDPPGGSHSVMQLNMGEGKTAVIVPLLCLTLGDGKSLCRVIVLKSLFRTNLAALRYSLGGLLNRRLYTFPCRRDMEIGESEAKNIMSVYKECLKKRGIVMTLPEYILSFELKMYETAQKNNISVASALLKTYKWLNSHARDVLDESDEILHAKYQLIYTVGKKVPPGGGNLRWTVPQGLLKLVPSKLKVLLEKHGVRSVEFDQEFEKSNGKEMFTPCRLLRDDIYQELIDALAEDFLDGRTSIKFVELKNSDRVVVKQFLTQRKIENDVYEKFQKLFEDNLIQKDTLLILAGYLKYEVLGSALFKRWRVNYGVNPTGRLRMAVPFKAKDVAAEMTEFGHPDIAICLTQLSYYYSGLSDDQLLECFQILEQMPNGNKHYESWIDKVKMSGLRPVDSTVENYEGLPLDDSKKREEFLFPILRNNMYVIDFWLGKKVFPNEARQFEKKMMATSWDLCLQDKKLVTGFSGTNDSKNLLPGPICQNDLPKLEKTNENVRKTLQRKENEGYLALPANVTGKTIIQTLVAQKIPVLLDSGALMLELSNEQVAKHWLEIILIQQRKNGCTEKIEAAVYFNDNDILMVKDLKNRDTELEQSPYKDRLECCVVYLDDSHTRGTDLKFPVGTKASVTLGSGISRDKTVQACMRMRMLGNGHSITFWASQEAHNSIVDLYKVQAEEIKTDHVLKWIEHNSKNFEKDGLIHWAAAGVSYAKKRAMHYLFSRHSEHLHALGAFCSDKEILELAKMFGTIKKEKLFTEIVDTQFATLIRLIQLIRRDYKSLNGKTVGSTRSAAEMTLKTKDEILKRLKKHIRDVTRFAEVLDEEQEKELQEEKERNIEMSVRPECKTPCESKLDEKIKNFLLSGDQPEKDFRNNSIIELPQVLRKYIVANLEDEKWSWGQKVFASRDFISVIRKTLRYNYERMTTRSELQARLKAKANEDNVSFDVTFLRPVVWIASVLQRNEMILLLLSPHEANAYLPIFRSKNTVSTLHMYSPRLKLHQNSLINNTNLQVPAGQSHFVDRHRQAQLSVFSGSLYFEEKEEQDEYCHFIGVIPRPRSDQHQTDFENGLISQSGFVAPTNRMSVSRELHDKCGFQKFPDKMIRDIAENRHGFFPRSSHVSMLVLESKDMTCEHNQ